MFVQGKGIDIVQPTPRNVLAMFLGREDLRQLWPLEVELQRGRHPLKTPCKPHFTPLRTLFHLFLVLHRRRLHRSTERHQGLPPSSHKPWLLSKLQARAYYKEHLN